MKCPRVDGVSSGGGVHCQQPQPLRWIRARPAGGFGQACGDGQPHRDGMPASDRGMQSTIRQTKLIVASDTSLLAYVGTPILPFIKLERQRLCAGQSDPCRPRHGPPRRSAANAANFYRTSPGLQHFHFDIGIGVNADFGGDGKGFAHDVFRAEFGVRFMSAARAAARA